MFFNYFASENLKAGLSVSGTLVENGLNSRTRQQLKFEGHILTQVVMNLLMVIFLKKIKATYFYNLFFIFIFTMYTYVNKYLMIIE